MKYALVTGGLGLIGTFISKELLDQSIVDKVVCLDHFGRYVSSTRPDFQDHRKHRLEMLGDRVIIERGESKYRSVIHKILEKYRPEYVFHLAALPLAKLDNLNSEEAIEGSVLSTTNILDIISLLSSEKSFVKRFVYASSSMVYGDFQESSATEEHPTNPKEIYGTMKLAGEVITRGLGKFHQIDFSIVRPSAVYGPTDMNRRVSQIFIDKARHGEKLTVQGEDEALDFTYVKDIANGFILAATRPEGSQQTFNITHGRAHTLIEFAETLKEFYPNLEYEVVPRDHFRPKRGTLSINKARKLLKYQPKYSLTEGIKECLEFYNN
tara:strand:+ start:366 stop:1337 length:972 start_codon:yes stop_codon:yes gene_type:complete